MRSNTHTLTYARELALHSQRDNIFTATSRFQTMKFDLSELNCIRFPKSTTTLTFIVFRPSMINAGSFLTSKYVYLNKQIKNNHMVDHTILREAICVFLFLHAIPPRSRALICSMLLIYFVFFNSFCNLYIFEHIYRTFAIDAKIF